MNGLRTIKQTVINVIIKHIKKCFKIILNPKYYSNGFIYFCIILQLKSQKNSQ